MAGIVPATAQAQVKVPLFFSLSLFLSSFVLFFEFGVDLVLLLLMPFLTFYGRKT